MFAKVQLGAALALVALDVALLLALNPLLESLVLAQLFLALGYVGFGLLRLAGGKGPTALQLLVALSLIGGLPLSNLRPRVILHRIEAIGTTSLLEDARYLSAQLSFPDRHREENLDGENLLIPQSLRELKPVSVVVREDAVLLTIWSGLSSRDTLVLLTDPTIEPGPVNRSAPTRTWRTGGDIHSERWIAPGLRWDFWGT